MLGGSLSIECWGLGSCKFGKAHALYDTMVLFYPDIPAKLRHGFPK